MKKFLIITLLTHQFIFSQTNYEAISISEDLELIKISDNAYVHVSWFHLPQFGRFPSNGLIFVQKGKAFLFDTPMTEDQTKDLVSFIKDSLGIEITGFIPNHWHDDCTGGMAYLHSIGVESYANEMTIEILKPENLPLPKHGFTNSLTLMLNDKEIISSYFGPGHASDNIVCYIPSEKILFGGCMVKEMSSKGLGNTADADLAEWPKTIDKVLERYSDAQIVIPGHGKFGGIELLKHTKELLEGK